MGKFLVIREFLNYNEFTNENQNNLREKQDEQ